jgi:DNA (cytosine-5)-methyltransferase 1
MDLFAGCGGLSLGLEQAGFEPVFVNELNKDAMETYLINRDEIYPLLRKKYHAYDVKDLTEDGGKKLVEISEEMKSDFNIDLMAGELDLIVGGPPCQGFSRMGFRRSYAVEKVQIPTNHLYEDMADIIGTIRPKMFLFENVRGLLTARWTEEGEKGEIWSDVRRKLATIPGYIVESAVVFAKDYGVPQNRPRVLLVGIREDVSMTIGFKSRLGQPALGLLPASGGVAPHLEDLLSDLIDDSYVNGGRTATYQRDPQNAIQHDFRCFPRTGRIMAKGEPVLDHEYSRHSRLIVDKFEAMLQTGGKIPEELRTKKFGLRLLPRTWGKDGPTITATSMPDDYVHYQQPRTLSVREWARLQMFPDWYRFAGSRTTGGVRRAGNPLLGIHDREVPKYTQIGNAVPVGLARAIGEHFKTLLAPSLSQEREAVEQRR